MNLLRGIQRAARADSLKDARVEKVKFRVRDQLSLSALSKNRQADGDQQVLENTEIIFHDFC